LAIRPSLSANTNAQRPGAFAAPAHIPSVLPIGWTRPDRARPLVTTGATAAAPQEIRTSGLTAFNTFTTCVAPMLHRSGRRRDYLTPAALRDSGRTQAAPAALSLCEKQRRYQPAHWMAHFEITAERRDNYIAGISTGRQINNGGQPMVSCVRSPSTTWDRERRRSMEWMSLRGLVDQFTSVRTIEPRFRTPLLENFKITATRDVRFPCGMDRCACERSWTDRRSQFHAHFTGRGLAIGFGFDVGSDQFGMRRPGCNLTVIGSFSFRATIATRRRTPWPSELNGRRTTCSQ
jgi:hypothetical protein